MNSPERHIDISQARALKDIFRLGETFAAFTQLEPIDHQTTETLINLNEQLKHGPALLLDYHSTSNRPPDMIHTGMAVTNNAQVNKVIVPGSAGDLFYWPLRLLISPISHHPNIHLFPVMRDYREHEKPSQRDLRSFRLQTTINQLAKKELPRIYPPFITKWLSELAMPIDQSLSFIKKSLRAIRQPQPGTLIFTATYSESDSKHTTVHKGVRKLLKENPPIYYSISLLNQADNRYHLFLSQDPTGFSALSDNDHIDHSVSQSHQALLNHAFEQIPTLTTDSISIKTYLHTLFSKSIKPFLGKTPPSA